MGVGTIKVATAAIVCIMVKRQSLNGRQSVRRDSSFVTFPDDLCKIGMKQKNQIAKFGYLGDPKNQIFGNLVIWVTQP
jgi:hypothetical protein